MDQITWKAGGGNFVFNFGDLFQVCYPLDLIEQLAGKHKISLRTGCFCNPGIDELNHCIEKEQLQKYFDSREYGDYDGYIEFQGRARGAVRLSVGLATTSSDIEKFFLFAKMLLNKTVDKAPLYDPGFDISLGAGKSANRSIRTSG